LYIQLSCAMISTLFPYTTLFRSALIWIISTYLGYKSIKGGKIRLHEDFMIYSYAACFAAVTLRFWLPILTILLDDFIFAYRIVADRKSTRLNSSHVKISYAVFCL